MPDLVLWLLLALAAVLSAMVLSAVMEVLFGREPAEPAPLAFDPIVLPPADDITRVLPVRYIGRAQVRPRLSLSSLALLVDFIAVESAVQHALEWGTPLAPIWTEVDGVWSARSSEWSRWMAKGMRTA